MNIATAHAYRLKILGPLDDDFVTSYCPEGTMLSVEGDLSLLDRICADQSAVIGLLRHLHNMGCTIVEMTSDSLTIKEN